MGEIVERVAIIVFGIAVGMTVALAPSAWAAGPTSGDSTVQVTEDRTVPCFAEPYNNLPVPPFNDYEGYYCLGYSSDCLVFHYWWEDGEYGSKCVVPNPDTKIGNVKTN